MSEYKFNIDILNEPNHPDVEKRWTVTVHDPPPTLDTHPMLGQVQIAVGGILCVYGSTEERALDAAKRAIEDRLALIKLKGCTYKQSLIRTVVL